MTSGWFAGASRAHAPRSASRVYAAAIWPGLTRDGGRSQPLPPSWASPTFGPAMLKPTSGRRHPVTVAHASLGRRTIRNAGNLLHSGGNPSYALDEWPRVASLEIRSRRHNDHGTVRMLPDVQER